MRVFHVVDDETTYGFWPSRKPRFAEGQDPYVGEVFALTVTHQVADGDETYEVTYWTSLAEARAVGEAMLAAFARPMSAVEAELFGSCLRRTPTSVCWRVSDDTPDVWCVSIWIEQVQHEVSR